MKRMVAVLFALASVCCSTGKQARNVILFVADAAGIPTVSAASIYGHGGSRRLFVQNMPHIGLMETSAADEWVTDSAAASTAIVTGRKTRNGVLSQSTSVVRGERDGEALKTILEYAEERRLATGFVTNSAAISATPAACYAHVNDRKKIGEIAMSILRPRFGDGVDVIIAAGREEVLAATRQLGRDFQGELAKRGPVVSSLEELPADARRAVVLFDHADFDLGWATREAIRVLSRTGGGFFLMVESDCHTENPHQGLKRMVDLDRVIRDTAQSVNSAETLILFVADHSYDFRVFEGRKGEPLLTEEETVGPGTESESVRTRNLRRDDDHTGEEVMVAAQGPGAERVRGVLSNTDLFAIMMSAYGWNPDPPAVSP